MLRSTRSVRLAERETCLPGGRRVTIHYLEPTRHQVRGQSARVRVTNVSKSKLRNRHDYYV